jgi:hypothetical protein
MSSLIITNLIEMLGHSIVFKELFLSLAGVPSRLKRVVTDIKQQESD